MADNTFRYSWGFFTQLITSSLQKFPEVWGGLALLVLLFALFSILVTGIFVGAGLGLLGGMSGLENLYANVTMTGNVPLEQIWTLGILGTLWLLVISVLAIQFWVAQVLAIREAQNKKDRAPVFYLFFQQSWRYFLPVCWGGLRAFWYVMWPLLAFLVVILGMSLVLDFIPLPILFLSWFLILVLSLLMLGFIIYRSVHLLFWSTALVDQELSGKKSIETSLNLVKGNWWGSFLVMAGIVSIVVILTLFYQWPLIWTDIMTDPFMGYVGWTAYDVVFFEIKNYPFSLYEALTILDIFLQMFIFAPFYTFFLYQWMTKVREEKCL
jgi:hypothetical protein